MQNIDLLAPISPLKWYLSVVKLISFTDISLDSEIVSKWVRRVRLDESPWLTIL